MIGRFSRRLRSGLQGLSKRPGPRAQTRGLSVLLIGGAALVGAAGTWRTTAPPIIAQATVQDVAAAPDVAPLSLVGPFEVMLPPAPEPFVERPVLASRGDRWADPAERERVWQPAAVPTVQPKVRTYQVSEGDRVVDLATRFGISPATIIRANALANAEKLGIGQELKILAISGRMHTVGEGDSVLKLAEKYRVIPESIVAANRLDDADLIRPGQELLVPMSEEEERAAAAAEAAPPKPLRPITHTVEAGETIVGLAMKYGVTTESIHWANNFPNADDLAIGQTITVPPVSGIIYRVEEGDSLVGVASRYAASATDIIRVNGVAEPFVVRPGDLLVVPGGRPIAPTAPSIPLPAQVQVPTTSEDRAARSPAPAPVAPASVAPAPPPAPAAPVRAPAPAPARAALATVRAPVPAAPVYAPAGPANSSIAGIALSQLGARYVWGGTTPSGFDCSGFVMWASRRAGLAVPRDMWGQLQSGPRISRDNLQAGDIVFFQNTYMPGMSHNGIYIGGSRFVHAASESTGVITTSLNDPYWGPRYMGATRSVG